MKKSYILIALAMVAALSMTGCKNNKKNQEPTQEEIQEQKQELADSLLAKLDALAYDYQNALSNSFIHREFALTDAEKLLKPDYLLDLSKVNELVTKEQKINGLAIYTMELGLREIYGMPLDEAKEVIFKLAAEVNYPIDFDALDKGMSVSDFVRKEYENCKNKKEFTKFWQYQSAVVFELGYLIAQNPDLFFDRITEEQWQAYHKQVGAVMQVICLLAEHDKEMAAIVEAFKPLANYESHGREMASTYGSKELARQYYIDHKDIYVANRDDLLKMVINFPF